MCGSFCRHTEKRTCNDELTALGEEDPVLTPAMVVLNRIGLLLAAAQQQVGFVPGGGDRDGDAEGGPVDLAVVFLWDDGARVLPGQVVHRQPRRVVNPAGGGEVCSNLQHWRLRRGQQQVPCRTPPK